MKLKQSLIMLASIVAWGGLNQVYIAAGTLIFLILLNLKIPWRLEIQTTQFYRFTDLCTVLFILLLAYGYFFQSDSNPIFSLLKWAPVLVSPILFAQLFSTRNTLPMGALFYSMRGSQQNLQKEIDFTLPFAAITIFAGAAANDQTSLYFFAMVLIFSCMLWFERPGHGKIVVWLLLISVVIGITHFGHAGLRILSASIQEKSIEWLSDWATDPFKSYTSIGQIGDLKLSDKIVFRVKGDGPLLLHQSSYDRYWREEWHASKKVFRPYKNAVLDKNNQLNTPKNLSQLEIFQTFSGDEILALPDGFSAIAGLEGAEMEQTELGAVKVFKPPPIADYKVTYSGIRRSEPTRFDLVVPEQHRGWLRQLSEKLQLKQKTPGEIAVTIESFFKTHYFYTLFTPRQSDADQALKAFINERRAGHCEYFAVATVFLLRYSGIPARYANGYSMQEFNESLGMYVVRRRHSHAWAIAEIGGRWQNVDSTPAQWLDMENDNASSFQPVLDWFSTAYFRFNQWRSRSGNLSYVYVLWAALSGIICYLIWIFYKGKIKLAHDKSLIPVNANQPSCAGMDSEFFFIDQYFEQYEENDLPRERCRQKNESVFSWAKRLGDPELEKIAWLHNRYRFDPDGLSEIQRVELQSMVKSWLEKANLL